MKTGFRIFLFALAALFLGGGAYWIYPFPARMHEIRDVPSPYLRIVDAGDYAPDIQNSGSDSGLWSMRSPASRLILNPSLVEALNFVRTTHFLAETTPESPGRSNMLAPVLAQDGISQPMLYASLPADYQDVLNESGQPLRWLKSARISYSSQRESKKSQIAASNVPRVRLQPVSHQARDYRPLVESFANRFDLNADLVMAIIHSESNFSPHLVSSKSAMGLMQLLPSTASDEVHRFLYGKRGDISFAELSQPETNIRYGTAYLHILHNRYFPNVRDREVKEACVVASYNLGPNRFLRLYGPNNESAVANINSLSREEFFEDLYNRLPSRETRFYVEKVRRMKSRYSSLN